MKKATFAGGCFWCLVPPFENIEGVKKIIAGYAGEDQGEPDYLDVAMGRTRYREAVQIEYNEKKVSYLELLEIFWRQIDPTDEGGQFADRGNSYKTAIFYHDEDQKKTAEKSKKTIQDEFREKIATEILEFVAFYKAEEEHQDYHKKNPVRYNLYKAGSGRQSYIEKVWGSRIRK